MTFIWPKKQLALLVSCALLSACGALPKTPELIDAEQAYQRARQDPIVLQYANPQLEEAAATLKQAAAAEASADMNSLTYIGKTQLDTALATAARKKADEDAKNLADSKERIQLQAREAELRASLAKKDQALMEKERALAEAKKLQDELDALKAEKTDRGMVLTIGDVLFATGHADLLAGAVENVNRLATFLQNHPEKTLLIEGHTDNVGGDAYNLGLSQQRAESVRNALLTQGIASNRMSAVGYGKAKPIADNGSSEGRQRNRRVEVVIQN